MPAEAFDRDAFAALQSRLAQMWPTLTLRSLAEERTLFVVSSLTTELPSHVFPLLPAYEERYLFYVLSLAQAPNTRVVYVTSQPMLPRMLDYYLGLRPGVDCDELRSRLVPVSIGDWSPTPLTQKILDRPRVVARLRSLVRNPAQAVLLPFVTTALEARLAVELGVPVYGPHPDLAALGTKSGSRQVFAAAGVPCPQGTEGVRTREEVLDALAALDADAAMVKLDASVSGLGNAVVDLRGVDGRADLEARLDALRPEDETLDAASFLGLLEEAGGIVEERITGTVMRSPSVQLRASPGGGVEVLTTHDQLLGGPSCQTYFGCRFPADPGYASVITEHAVAVGDELARRGVIGRFAVDFVVTPRGEGWTPHAVEVNLRNGGTTHPSLALLGLTEGEYDPTTACFTVDGAPKHYVATDHLEVPDLRSLTPDDVLDVIEESGLGWDHVSRTGLVLHMLSAVGVAGRVGLTAVADSAPEADALYDKAAAVLADAARH